MSARSIAAIIGVRKADQGSVRTFIRDNIQSNPKAIELLAEEIAKTSANPAERDNRLSILRMRLREVCDEIGIPKLTVKLRGASYRLEASFATSRSATGVSLEDVIYRPLRQAVATASPREREVMLAVVMEIFGLSRRG